MTLFKNRKLEINKDRVIFIALFFESNLVKCQ